MIHCNSDFVDLIMNSNMHSEYFIGVQNI